MKKLGSMMLVICMILCTMIGPTAYADQEGQPITVLVNGEQLDFDVNPLTENDRTLVPMRMIFEALGAEVTWDDETNTARVVKETLTIEITIDQMYLLKNGSKVALDVPARLVNNRTLVPIRAISEGLDAKVEWNEELKQVIIATKEEEIPPTPSPIPSPTKTQGREYAFNELSTKDLQILKESYDRIRSDFAYNTLPSIMFSNSSDFAKLIQARDNEVKESMINVWNKIVVDKILQIQKNSDSNYAIKAEEDISVDQYLPLIKDAGLEANQYLVFSYKKATDESMMLFLSFLHTDKASACKYMSLVATSKYGVRCFMAQTNTRYKPQLAFSEIMQDVSNLNYIDWGPIEYKETEFCKAVKSVLIRQVRWSRSIP